MAKVKKIKIVDIKTNRVAQAKLRKNFKRCGLSEDIAELDKISGINNSNVKKLQQSKINSKGKVLHTL